MLRELNYLREELKILRDRIQDYETARETAETKGIHSIDALIQTLNSDAGLFDRFVLDFDRRDHLGNYTRRQRDQELHKEVEKNQREITRLRQRLAHLQFNGEQISSSADPNDQSGEISIIRLS